METAGSGRVINDSGSTICDASQRPDVTAAIDTLDDASEPTQSCEWLPFGVIDSIADC